MLSLPKEPQSTLPPKRLPKILFLLILVFLVLFTSLTLFYLYLNKGSSENEALIEKEIQVFIESFKKDTELISFHGDLWRQRFNEYLDQAVKEVDSQKQFELLSKTFAILVGEYTASHNPQLRHYAGTLKTKLKSDFGAYYKEENFSLPCWEESCRTVTYPPEIKNISDAVKEFNFSNENFKKNILNNIDKALYETNKESQWSYYDLAYKLILVEYKKSKDNTLRNILTKFSTFIKESYPKNYQSVLVYEGENNRYVVR